MTATLSCYVDDLLTRSHHFADFQGLHTIAGAGDPRSRSGMAVHVYCCNTSMSDKSALCFSVLKLTLFDFVSLLAGLVRYGIYSVSSMTIGDVLICVALTTAIKICLLIFM